MPKEVQRAISEVEKEFGELVRKFCAEVEKRFLEYGVVCIANADVPFPQPETGDTYIEVFNVPEPQMFEVMSFCNELRERIFFKNGYFLVTVVTHTVEATRRYYADLLTPPVWRGKGKWRKPEREGAFARSIRLSAPNWEVRRSVERRNVWLKVNRIKGEPYGGKIWFAGAA